VSLPKHASVADLYEWQEDPRVNTEQYRHASERFLIQARAELDAGDLAQASE